MLDVTLPAIRRIKLKDIGPFQDAVFDVPEDVRLILLEGPNGAGKTTLMEALAGLLGRAAPSPTALNRTPDNAFYANLQPNPANRNPRIMLEGLMKSGIKLGTLPPNQRTLERMRGPDASVEVEFANGSRVALVEGARDHYGATVDVTTHGQALIALDEFDDAAREDNPTSFAAFSFRGTMVGAASLETDGPKELKVPALVGALSFGELVPGALDLGQILLNFEFERIQASDYARGNAGDAANFGAVSRARGDALIRFKTALSRLLDVTVDIHFRIGARSPELRFDGEVVPLDLLAEGFRRTLSWAADLVSRLERTKWRDETKSPFDQRFLLLLDEVEPSLHPKLQRNLLPALLALFPNATIIASTHSPFLVASAGEGCVFRLSLDKASHRVIGVIPMFLLQHGQSLSWVTEEVFGLSSDFVDEETNRRLKEHAELVDALRAGRVIDWNAFRLAHDWLFSLNGEARTIAVIREAPIAARITEELAKFAS